MTLKEQVRKMLEIFPQSRERKKRYEAIWHIIFDKYHKDSIDKAMFLEVGPEILSITRLINQFQQFYPGLRGSDYDDKTMLVQKKQIELGYTPGYHQDVKKLRTHFPDNEIEEENKWCDVCKRLLSACVCDGNIE